MDTMSKNPKKWLKFDFPAGCVFNESDRDSLKRWAVGSQEGGCCPYYFCCSAKTGSLCDPETTKECARRCEEFYEKYIKGGEK